MKITAARALADTAITFELAETIGAEAAARVRRAAATLAPRLERGELPGATELAQAFCSVTLHYDPLEGSHDDLVARVEAALAEAPVQQAQEAGRAWRLPCCYENGYGEDLAVLATGLHLSPDEIVARHAETRFEVYALGFLPGLPFMGGLPEGLSLPRRSEPRTRVAAGSVAIAGGLCVIYPWQSPGGWHIVGRCPVPLFDIARAPPALLRVGDRVAFEPVSAARLDEIAGGVGAGTITPEAFLKAPA